MLKKIFGATIFIFLLTNFFVNSAQAIWRLDGSDEKILPQNFRTMSDAWHIEMYFDDGNREGLKNLNCSASGQPSLEGLKIIFEKIKNISPESEIFLIDLRQESHGFADNFPVSWYVEKNQGNYFKGYEEDYELEQLQSLRGNLTEFVPLGNHDKKYLKKIKFSPQKTLTEREAATFAGFKYFRFAAADMLFPAPQVVDEFLNFVQNLPKNSWLHFHCQAGHGRTTTFLVFYDILKNPQLSLEEICKRQYYLGGSNLLQKSSGNDWYAWAHNDRAEKIKIFYKFVHESKGENFTDFYLKNI